MIYVVPGYMPKTRHKTYMKLIRKLNGTLQTFKEVVTYDMWFWILLDVLLYATAHHYVMHTLDVYAPTLVGR